VRVTFVSPHRIAEPHEWVAVRLRDDTVAGFVKEGAPWPAVRELTAAMTSLAASERQRSAS
jgi:hypothetical protein